MDVPGGNPNPSSDLERRVWPSLHLGVFFRLYGTELCSYILNSLSSELFSLISVPCKSGTKQIPLVRWVCVRAAPFDGQSNHSPRPDLSTVAETDITCPPNHGKHGVSKETLSTLPPPSTRFFPLLLWPQRNSYKICFSYLFACLNSFWGQAPMEPRLASRLSCG